MILITRKVETEITESDIQIIINNFIDNLGDNLEVIDILKKTKGAAGVCSFYSLLENCSRECYDDLISKFGLRNFYYTKDGKLKASDKASNILDRDIITEIVSKLIEDENQDALNYIYSL